MAEVLAAEQPDRMLPLVLDDSATNIDPDRLRQVGFLLAHASTRGVQVVFATCDTERANGLRAECVVRLPRPAWNGGDSIPRADAPIRTTKPAAVDQTVGDTGDDAAQLVAALRATGGECSARALREQLDWEKPRFDAARETCIASGEVVAPEGSRSLRLREPTA
jgi:predicted ATPase